MTRIPVVALAVVSLVVLPGIGLAGEEHLAGDDQKVWKVIMDSWEAIAAEDVAWSDKWVHPRAVVWGTEYPLPRMRESIKKWDRFNFDNSKTLTSDFGLAGLVVQGDTAVAHYYYSLGTEDREGKRETTHGRCTDILVRDGDSWKFIAWHCGDMPKQNA